MACGIYKITNKINNHSYIGQSINITERWSNEKIDSKNENSKSYNSILSQAFRKYGIENFSFEILEECSKEELNDKEKYYIQHYDTYNNGYNATTGGDGVMNSIFKLSQEEIEKIYDLLLHSNIPQKEIAEQFQVGEDVISTINNGKSRRQLGYDFPLRINILPKKYCVDCGQEIGKTSIRCVQCERVRHRKVERPTRDKLKFLVRTQSFTSIGKMYGVSDNTIRKWCNSYNLPSSVRIIKKYSNEQWENI